MKSISHLLLFVALTIVLLTSACTGQQVSPTATTQPTVTATINVTSTATTTLTPTLTETLTPVIPVTGPITASLVCQFCMDTFTYVLLDIPAGATFTLLTPTPSASATSTDIGTGCNVVETFRDRQLVLCHAPSNTSLSMDVCRGNDCYQFMIRLQVCPPPTPDSITPTWTPTFTPVVSMTPTLPLPVSSPTSAVSTITAGSPIATVTGGTATPTMTVSPTVTP